MTADAFYKAHWKDISDDRMTAYRSGFGWDAATEAMLAPLGIEAGHIVADFGCGPGKVAVEIARRVGPAGHVHALDINAEFLTLVQENATGAGVAGRVTTHLNDGVRLPFDDASADRIIARNTLMYVDDPVATLSEFRRVLKPGGRALCSDGDWYMMVAEPVEHDLWREFVKAAGHACRSADMGRKLRAAFLEAGFRNVDVSLHATPDETGRLMGMIRNMAAYAKESGQMAPTRADDVALQMEEALAAGTYLVISPQFAVIGEGA